MKYLGLLNSQLSLIFPALIQVFGIFLLREHFKTIPDELEEAARLEGAGELRILRLVVVPLSLARDLCHRDYHRPVHLERLFLAEPLYHQQASRIVAPLGLVTLQNAYQSGPVGAIFASCPSSLSLSPCSSCSSNASSWRASASLASPADLSTSATTYVVHGAG